MSWVRSNDRTVHTFQEYPQNQPFIYDNYRRDPNRPVKAYPESNRRDILSALKNLQDKIRRIELEDGHHHGDTHDSQRSTHESRTTQVNGIAQTEEKSMMTDEVHLKLDAGQKRCQLLERQLDDMRNMLQQAEVDRSEALRKSALLRDSQSSSKQSGRTQADKLLELEREQLRLMAMQTLAASQIQELEEQLQMERHYRKMMQNKATELESAAEANRILLESNKPNKTRRKKRAASAGKSPNVRRTPVRKRHPTNARPASEHYRLNLAEIPFINGRSTGRSHSLSANFQEVLSLMKSHTPRLCRLSHAAPRASSQHTTVEDGGETTCNCERDDEDDTEVETEKTLRNSSLSQLLVQLQDEFGHMSFEHKELLHQIQEANDQHVRDDLERELDCLVARMEVKSDQITRLRRYQETMVKKKRKASKSKTSVSRPASAGVSHTSRSVKSPKKAKTSVTGASPGVSKAQGSLNLLKDLKRIQSSLRADDIVWD